MNDYESGRTLFMPDTRFITEFDQYLFGQGTHYDLYNKLGAHPMTVDEEEGVYFAVWHRMRQQFPLLVILMNGMRMRHRWNV